MSKTLVIVESPTKAKTISKFLDASYTVTSSFGHVRDLPKSTMGIDTEDGTYEPTYIVSEDKEKKVQELKKMAARADEIIFATDEDREGEAISWHLAELFGMNPEKVKRIVFHEITKDAILHAIKAPRHIDTKLVDAQQARRVIDRLVGYELSPLLWKKISRGLSAGRVQSVAVRLIVEREREIRAFTPEEYWTLEASLQSTTDTSHTIMATLHSANGSILKKLDIPNKEAMDTILQDLAGASYIIDSIEEKETQKTPPPPFSTSTLQQTANNVLGYSSKYTMRIAQTLYEGIDIGHEQVGLITYMRTDSLSLSDSFLSATTKFVQDAYGQKYTINAPRTYKTKKKGAQEAHEAIRPTDPTRTPASLAGKLDGPELKLYTLIWNRTVATQMAAARLNRTNIHISAGTYGFKTTGQTMLFDGWMKLYPAMMKEAMLPALANGTILNCTKLTDVQHFTKPPARYSDATLVKALEEHEIGRPSTYAPTISTIEARQYVERDDDKRLYPTDVAIVVNDMLVEHFSSIVDLAFTAKLEQEFDDIAEGTHAWKEIVKAFYEPFHKNIIDKTDHLEREEVVHMRELGTDPKSGKPVYTRIGRFGAFVQLGSKEDEEKPTFASLQKGQSTETITLAEALELLTLPKVLGIDEATGTEIKVSIGRFGPYVQVGKSYYSLKEDDPYTITLERAKIVIEEGKIKEARKHIKTFEGSSIQILDGRWGPYVTDGEKNGRIQKTAAIKDIDDPDTASEAMRALAATLTLEDCEDILKNARPSKWKNKKVAITTKKVAAPKKKRKKTATKKKKTT